MSEKKYTLSVACLFKNESHSLKEWIEHYLYHGAEHFYLIDDGSTDNYMDILQLYIDKKIVDLFKTEEEHYPGRQGMIYTNILKPIMHETEWLLICDMDEFVWSPKCINLYSLINELNKQWHYSQIQFEHSLYGSNGLIEQPNSIIAGFTKRAKDEPYQIEGNLKYFLNTKYPINRFFVHYAELTNEKDKEGFIRLDPSWFTLNHYRYQSKNFWNSIKCTRGDADIYRTRTPEDFDIDYYTRENINQVTDTRLFEQNKPLLEKLGLL
jgi:hypothetical protein